MPARFALLALLASLGCASVYETRVVAPERTAERCVVPIHRLRPTRFVEVGSAIIEAAAFTTPIDVEKELVRRACGLQADAIVILDEAYGVPFAGTFVRAAFVQMSGAGMELEK